MLNTNRIKDCTSNILSQTSRKFKPENMLPVNKQLHHETWLDFYNASIINTFYTFNKILMYYFTLCFP